MLDAPSGELPGLWTHEDIENDESPLRAKPGRQISPFYLLGWSGAATELGLSICAIFGIGLTVFICVLIREATRRLIVLRTRIRSQAYSYFFLIGRIPLDRTSSYSAFSLLRRRFALTTSGALLGLTLESSWRVPLRWCWPYKTWRPLRT